MRKALLIVYGLVGWVICGGTIAVGRQVLTMETTLVIHAIVAPVAFGMLSIIYRRQFPATLPIVTALTFLTTVIALDMFLVAPFIEQSFAMFESPLGTWIPFALIFIASLLAGGVIGVNRSQKV